MRTAHPTMGFAVSLDPFSLDRRRQSRRNE